MSYFNGPKIVTNGLVCLLDAGNAKSWASGSATWTDLTQNGNDFTVLGNPAPSLGGIQFSGLSQYATCNVTSLGDWGTSGFCLEVVCAIYSAGGFSPTIIKRNGITSIGGAGLSGWAHRFGSSFFVQDSSGSAAAGGAIINLNDSSIATPVIGVPIQYTFNIARGNNGYQNTGQAYVNGRLMQTSVAAFTGNGIVNSAVPINFFREPAGGSVTSGIGYIFRAYNRPLAPEEIAQNWNATRGRWGL